MKLRLFSGFIIIVCVVSILYADIIFEDDFNTKENWIALSSSGTISIESGTLVVETGNDSWAYLLHSKEVEDFTYAAKFNVKKCSEAGGSGIAFCVQNNADGYWFFISAADQYYYILKYLSSGAFEYLAFNTNSFINITGNNELKVSKEGEELRFYCNGIMVEKLSDSSIKKGNIGLIVGPGEKTAYDRAVLRDDIYKVDTKKKYFSDTFENDAIQGWKLWSGNGIEEKNGKLTISSSKEMWLFTSGLYKDIACTTIVTYNSGDTSKLYGLMLLEIQPIIKNDSLSFKTSGYYYTINAERSYAVFEGGTQIKSNSHIHGSTDTLIITKDYKFMVNGKIIDDGFSKGKNFNAVGFYAEAGVSVSFDNFSAGNPADTSGIIAKHTAFPFPKKNPSYLIGGIGIIYDPMGRQVATFDGTVSYKHALKNLSSGPYIVITRKKNFAIHRAVINIQ